MQGEKRPPSPKIKESEFLSAAVLVFEKEGCVTNKLIRKHFFSGYRKSAISERLKRLKDQGVLVEKVPFKGGQGAERVYAFAPESGNGNGNGSPAVALPSFRPKPQIKAPPEPFVDLESISEFRALISQTIERLEEFQEKHQEFQESLRRLLAGLLDADKDWGTFEKVTEVLGCFKTLALAAVTEIKRGLDHHGHAG